MEGTEHNFGPFQEKDIGAMSGGPLFSRPLWISAEKEEDCIQFSFPICMRPGIPKVTFASLLVSLTFSGF